MRSGDLTGEGPHEEPGAAEGPGTAADDHLVPYAREGGRLSPDPAPEPGPVSGPDPGPGGRAAAVPASPTAPAAPASSVPSRSPVSADATGDERRIRLLRSLLRVLPALMAVGGAVYGICTPRGFTGAPLFTAAPLVAAPLYSFLGTAVTGVAAVAGAYAVHARSTRVPDADAVTEIVTVATVAVMAAVINRVVRRGDQRLASARGIAEAAQRAVLPEPAARIGGYDVAARYEAAQADAFIGGDLYAVQDTPRGVRLVVGDVRGKGMGAVSAVAVVIGAFREAAEQEATLEAVAQRLERALAREGTRRDGPDAFEGFTTAVLAELPHGDETVRILNRGHPPPLLLHPDGTVRPLPAHEPALPLGMGELAGRPDRAEETRFPRGATLLLHTDGVSEARDAQGRFYEPEERLAGRSFRDPEELLAALARDVHRHCGGGLTDDMALLAVRRP
ncbi:PP2C family protein-serine/threonine phosphatase [Streptomyces sp. NPDC059766]|uniref:PP2C family protein-serine/threonine phosphatase n=1 Tax=Streptomyces sp. NPDC059766 TaxID=3346940 RepID=UPI003651EA51